jgi:hypothetical protein
MENVLQRKKLNRSVATSPKEKMEKSGQNLHPNFALSYISRPYRGYPRNDQQYSVERQKWSLGHRKKNIGIRPDILTFLPLS